METDRKVCLSLILAYLILSVRVLLPSSGISSMTERTSTSPVAQRLASLVRWDSVILVQRFRSRAADAWFTHFPLLGNELQYVLGIPLLAWFVHDAAVVRRCLLFGAISCFVANGLKGVFKLPRPPLKLHVGVGGASHDLIAQQAAAGPHPNRKPSP